MIRFGPSGIGGVKEAVSNLEKYHNLGLKACEIAFTYGIYIKEGKDAEKIGKAAKKFDIKLSIHAPYYINLNSEDRKKKEASKKRIIECCEIGEKLGAEVVVFHAGFYGKMGKEETFQNIKKEVLELIGEVKENKWKIKIAAETMGKINVFGSADEILRLEKETGCFICIDFAHLWAREQGKISYSEIYEKFRHFPELHCHFSGINFGEKGEKNHTETSEAEIRKLLSALPKTKNITIINEAPYPADDAKKMLDIHEKM